MHRRRARLIEALLRSISVKYSSLKSLSKAFFGHVFCNHSRRIQTLLHRRGFDSLGEIRVAHQTFLLATAAASLSVVAGRGMVRISAEQCQSGPKTGKYRPRGRLWGAHDVLTARSKPLCQVHVVGSRFLNQREGLAASDLLVQTCGIKKV